MSLAARPTRPRSGSRVLVLVGASVALTATVACTGYSSGTLLIRHQGTSVNLGCLDVAVEPVSDEKAEGPAARITVGNTCNAGVLIDYRNIGAMVRYDDGFEESVYLYDPENTLRPVIIDGRGRGREAFEFHPEVLRAGGRPGPGMPGQPTKHERIPVSLCLDVSRLDSARPSAESKQICVRVEAN